MNIKIDGLNTYYETQGVGECVLFMHGFRGSCDSFKGVYNKLKEKFKVLSLNFWGMDNDKSDLPKRTFFVEDYAKNVLLFLDALDLKRVNIVAHSFGGRVAIYLAANYPERVDKVILCDSAGIKPKKTIKYHTRVFKYKFTKILIKFKILKINALNKYGSTDYKSMPPVMRQTFINVVNENLLKYAKMVTCPVLIVWGKKDIDTPLYMAKRLHKNIKGSGLIVYENAGHYSYIDNFAEFCIVADYFFSN